ncbi:MAG: hypothetical protein LBN03_02680, partial [Bifidobacteriaceae bacterium]|nr:hypothetical protein [Bifidobacteriaceae bacterium]
YSKLQFHDVAIVNKANSLKNWFSRYGVFGNIGLFCVGVTPVAWLGFAGYSAIASIVEPIYAQIQRGNLDKHDLKVHAVTPPVGSATISGSANSSMPSLSTIPANGKDAKSTGTADKPLSPTAAIADAYLKGNATSNGTDIDVNKYESEKLALAFEAAAALAPDIQPQLYPDYGDKIKVPQFYRPIGNKFYKFEPLRYIAGLEDLMFSMQKNYATLLDVCDNPGIEDKYSLIEFNSKIKDVNTLLMKYRDIDINPDIVKNPEEAKGDIVKILEDFKDNVLKTAQQINESSLDEIKISQAMLDLSNDINELDLGMTATESVAG